MLRLRMENGRRARCMNSRIRNPEALVSDGVDWPDGAQRLHGRASVGDDCSLQWRRIQTYEEVLGVIDLNPDRTMV